MRSPYHVLIWKAFSIIFSQSSRNKISSHMHLIVQFNCNRNNTSARGSVELSYYHPPPRRTKRTPLLAGKSFFTPRDIPQSLQAVDPWPGTRAHVWVYQYAPFVGTTDVLPQCDGQRQQSDESRERRLVRLRETHLQHQRRAHLTFCQPLQSQHFTHMKHVDY